MDPLLRKWITWSVGVSGFLFALDWFEKRTKGNKNEVRYDTLGKKSYNPTQQTMNVLRDAAESEKPLYLMSPKELREFGQRNR